MSAAVRIAGFATVLALVFGLAALAGAELDPAVDETESHDEELGAMEEHDTQAGGESGSDGVPGLAVAQGGYRLVPERTQVPQDVGSDYRFRIVTDSGETVREFALEHERRMHLIIVRRDFAGFQHLHPQQRADGSWEAQADLSKAGVYRVFADFATDEASLTLGADLFVQGSFDPVALPEPDRFAEAGGGYTVAVKGDSASNGHGASVEFIISHDGKPVESVEPYLGADGHLVALREHDQAFLHVHPQGTPGGPGPISFAVEYPSAGRYRLFLQFKHRGEVRTAAFTQDVVTGAASAASGRRP